MLIITIDEVEFFDEESEVFINHEPVLVELEHSLLSLSKWEQKFKKPFLGPQPKTVEETFGYISAMVIGTPPEDLEKKLTKGHISEIERYIDSPESATTFGAAHSKNTPGAKEVITSELIYYWMVSHNIPFSCEEWNLNRLLALIRISSIKNSKQKKMSSTEIAARNRALNEERRAKMGSRG